MPETSAIRERILTHGLGIASTQGLTALTMGTLARELDLPRSGISNYFSDRESLQLGVLEQATNLFLRDVINASVNAAAGEARLKALFARWIAWSRAPMLKGGCPFVHASRRSSELAEPVRTRLKETLDGWSDILKQAIDDAKRAGQFRADLDTEQLVFELYGLYLSHHFFHWYMKDKVAEARTHKAYERVIAASR
ncbi:MAG: TetR/AcrR family transcriptional regulator [Hyphomicrobiaceae bacterium]|nr:TetR/AcrR family transcriptional regulator [Hyphomicrobiaceae bacterium]